MTRILVLMIVALLPACGALTSASQTLDVYELRAPEPIAASSRRSTVELVVEEPNASGALDTDRILIRPTPVQAQYLPGARWADPAPQMVQTLLLRSLTASGAFQSVGRRPIGSIGDFAVLTELSDFGAVPVGDQAQVNIRMSVRLVRERDATVVATGNFGASAMAGGTGTDEIVAAFDRALGDLLAAIIPWIIGRT